MSLAEGSILKDVALAMLAAARRVFVRRGRRALLLALLETGRATADTVYAKVKMPPDIDPRCLGAVPGPLAKAGIIRSVGFTKSSRRHRHASPIQVWQLVDRGAASEWLATHPDQPEDELEQLEYQG